MSEAIFVSIENRARRPSIGRTLCPILKIQSILVNVLENFVSEFWH